MPTKSPYKTLKLEYPIETPDGKKLTSLNIRRLKVGDMRVVSKQYPDQGDAEVALFARMTDLVPEDIDELDMADYTALQNVYKEITQGKLPPVKS